MAFLYKHNNIIMGQVQSAITNSEAWIKIPAQISGCDPFCMPLLWPRVYTPQKFQELFRFIFFSMDWHTKAKPNWLPVSLQDNENIVINKAGKGSATVVLNKCDYIEEGLKHLDAPQVYKQLKLDTTTFIRAFIIKFLSNIRFIKYLPTTFVDYCTPGRVQNITTVLPKENLQKTHGDKTYSISVTENISDFVDFWLQPLVK